MKKIFFWCSLPLLCLLFWQQSPNTDDAKKMSKETLIQNKLQERIDRFRSNKLKNCRKNAYDRATEIVDSTLIARAKTERLNKVNRPEKPEKPSRPDALSPKDTSALKPLIGH